MADINWMIDEVERGPQGAQVAAFFDFDGTLINGFSAAPYFRARIKAHEIDTKEILQTLIESVNIERRGHDISQLMEIVANAQVGKSADDLQDFGRRLFTTKIADMV